MSKILNIPEYIVNAIPTDGLWEDNRTDETQIGASYEELEWAMNYNNTDKINERQREILKIYSNFNTQNKHKMIPIPIFKKI
jgi:NAD+ synthase